MTDNLNAALADLDLDAMDDLLDEQPSDATAASGTDMRFFEEVPLTVTLEVASAQVSLGELSRVQHGDVLPLNKAAGEPLDVMVNGMLFAKAEVIMVNGRYGLKFIKSAEQDVMDLHEAAHG